MDPRFGLRSERRIRVCRKPLSAFFVATCAVGLQLQAPPLAHAVPGPEIEYTYDVIVRRHFDFPNNDAIGYGFGICGKVGRGEGYSQVMSDVKRDVLPNDELAANYVVSQAVGILCPAQIWQLRNSAAGYHAMTANAQLPASVGGCVEVRMVEFEGLNLTARNST